MKKFADYWIKGWKVVLMMFCVNISHLLFVIPAIIIGDFLIKNDMLIITDVGDLKRLYYFFYAFIWLMFGPAVIYFIFKLFYREQAKSEKGVRVN